MEKNDLAIRTVYSSDISCRPPCLPQYIVMPETKDEVADAIKIANKYGISFTPRGNGANHCGFAFSEGLVMDLSRMKKLEIDPSSWTATIGPGVTAYELQQEATKYNMRAGLAESAACVIANIVMTGIVGSFVHSYGCNADLFIDAEIVTHAGDIFTLSDKNSPNLLKLIEIPKDRIPASSVVCTEMTMKLFPILDDEEGVLIPFSDLKEGVALLRELGRRRIGVSAALISIEYFSSFIAPTPETIHEFRRIAAEDLGIRYLLVVVGDQYEMRTIKEMAEVTIDQEMTTTLILGLPKLIGNEGLGLLSEVNSEDKPYKLFFSEEMRPIVEMSLSPSPQNIGKIVDEELGEFFEKLYLKPEMTNLAWLNMFRILPARMSRYNAWLPRVLFFPLDDLDEVLEICQEIEKIGKKHNLKSLFGYMASADFGKRAFLEWDYYYDHLNEEDKNNVMLAIMEYMQRLPELMGRFKHLVPGELDIFRGMARKEYAFYGYSARNYADEMDRGLIPLGSGENIG